MPIGICPLVDYAFKLLLGEELYIHILIQFLNSMLEGQPRIVSARCRFHSGMSALFQ
ncbi:MAG: PD-(D/E)XK nuclease family transposase [Planctomycetaceae bacterium]